MLNYIGLLANLAKTVALLILTFIEMKKERIAISSPCHENWDSMTPSEKGRFCDSCNKEVHDVSLKTDIEIARELQQNQGDLCIRIPEYRIKDHSRAAKKGAAIILAFLISLWLSVKTSFAQLTGLDQENSFEEDSSKLEYFDLKGQVVDSLADPWGVPFATIRVFKDDQFIAGTYTDIDGKFKLRITGDEYYQGDSIRIEVHMFGYDTAQRKLTIQRDLETEVFLRTGVISLNELKVIVDRRDYTVVLGGGGLFMGPAAISRPVEYLKWDQYDTKTFSESEINRYQLGREDTDYSNFSNMVD